MAIHVVVMGVAGCGKTTVVQAVGRRMGFVTAEGDDFHSRHNVDLMSHGIALKDEDRWPWLRSISGWMVGQEVQGHSTIVSCSALKRSYRQALGEGLDVFFIHLAGPQELIGTRMASRRGHYMPPSLLASQFADLEPLGDDEVGVTISVDDTPAAIVNRVVKAIERYRDGLDGQAAPAGRGAGAPGPQGGAAA